MSKTILITGATSGIGRAVAIALANGGHRVIATGRSLDKLRALHEAAPNLFCVTKLDVTRNEDFDTLRQLLEEKGVTEIDTLDVNAAIHKEHTSDHPGVPYEQWPHKRIRCQTFEANYFGAMRTIDAFLPLVKRSTDGRVLFMNGTLGSIGWHHHENPKYRESLTIIHPEYSASKVALNVAMFHLARQHPELFVASVNPGWRETQVGGSGSAGFRPSAVERAVPGLMKFLVGNVNKALSGSFLDLQEKVVPF